MTVWTPVGGAHEEILERSGAKESDHIREHTTGMEQIADAVEKDEERQRMISDMLNVPSPSFGT